MTAPVTLALVKPFNRRSPPVVAVPSWMAPVVLVSTASPSVARALPSVIAAPLIVSAVPLALAAWTVPPAVRATAPPPLTVVAVMPPVDALSVIPPADAATAPSVSALPVTVAALTLPSDASVTLPASDTTDAVPPPVDTAPSVMLPAALRTLTAFDADSVAAVPGLFNAPAVSSVTPPPVPVAVRLPPNVAAMTPLVLASAVIVTAGLAAALGPATSTMPRSVTAAVVAVTTASISSTVSTALAAANTTLTPPMLPLATIGPSTDVPLLMVIDSGLPAAIATLTSVAATSATSPLAASVPCESTNAPSRTICPSPAAPATVLMLPLPPPVKVTPLVNANGPVNCRLAAPDRNAVCCAALRSSDPATSAPTLTVAPAPNSTPCELRT